MKQERNRMHEGSILLSLYMFCPFVSMRKKEWLERVLCSESFKIEGGLVWQIFHASECTHNGTQPPHIFDDNQLLLYIPLAETSRTATLTKGDETLFSFFRLPIDTGHGTWWRKNPRAEKEQKDYSRAFRRIMQSSSLFLKEKKNKEFFRLEPIRKTRFVTSVLLQSVNYEFFHNWTSGGGLLELMVFFSSLNWSWRPVCDRRERVINQRVWLRPFI